MTNVQSKKVKLDALRYHGGTRNNKVAKAQYLAWRNQQVPPLPERCDNPNCRYFLEPLTWNSEPLPLILEHTNGVNTDNRPKNLRLLCPNCDSQNIATRGGANAGRVVKSSGGFALVGRDGSRNYVLPAETGVFHLTGSDAKLIGPDSTR